MHLPGENGYRGPSLSDLYQRVIDQYKRDAEGYQTEDSDRIDHENGERLSQIAKGIEIGLEILKDPYKFLNEEERAGYDLASKIAKTAEEERLANPEKPLAKRGPGRPKGSKNRINEDTIKMPAKINIFRMSADGKSVQPEK